MVLIVCPVRITSSSQSTVPVRAAVTDHTRLEATRLFASIVLPTVRPVTAVDARLVSPISLSVITPLNVCYVTSPAVSTARLPMSALPALETSPSLLTFRVDRPAALVPHPSSSPMAPVFAPQASSSPITPVTVQWPTARPASVI